ncbi:ATP-binding protein [Atopobium fossor]|uniref:ATP-binding protein n=1 Tax=Atopobium fossor TaxID=39487 RepID=UPI0004164161|nr:DUF4143 domain-containing protein [Atopobium fossor]
MKKYMPRIADEVLKSRLEARGAVLVQGPKWCGKSTTAEQLAKSAVYMQNPSMREQNMMLAKADASRFLAGKTPKLIDEWQIIPFIWDAIRFEVDKRGEFGQFLLTGSVTPPSSDEITHSGTGRISCMTMHTMSLFESGDSSGEVSLKKLFDGLGEVRGTSDKSLEDLAFLTCRGGWPMSVGQKKNVALQQAIDYVESLLQSDYSKVDGISRDSGRMNRILKSYARNLGTQANYSTIKSDIVANEEDSISENTIASYLSVLNKLFVTEDLCAWNPNIRSKTAIRTSNTRHFTDPSIAAAALGLGPNDLMNDLKTFGFFFETLCVRDLRIYAQRLNGEVYHYRDKSGLESDAVVHLRDGRYGLVEVKLFSQEHIDEGASNLLTLQERIDTSRMKKASFLMVLTGTPYAYRREDGVIVAPLATLAP